MQRYCLEYPWKGGNYLGTGIGIILVLLGRRILDGKPRVSGRGTSPRFSNPSCKERNKAIVSISTQPNKWVTTRTCIIGKPTKGYPRQYRYIMLTDMNSGRGWHSQFFVKDLGLALARKMCPDQSQAFQEVDNVRIFSMLFSSGRDTFMCSKACFVQNVSRQYSKDWQRRTNIMSNLTPQSSIH